MCHSLERLWYRSDTLTRFFTSLKIDRRKQNAKFQSRIQATIQRLGAAAFLLPIGLLLLLGFLLLGRGQSSTLRAAGEAQVRSQAVADNNALFFPLCLQSPGDDPTAPQASSFVTTMPTAPGMIPANRVYRESQSQPTMTMASKLVPPSPVLMDSTALFLTANEKYRLEFTAIPDYLQPGVVGNQTEATVAFITAPSSDVNVGLNNPAEYCQENPELGTPCYIFGLSPGSAPGSYRLWSRSTIRPARETELDDIFVPAGQSPMMTPIMRIRASRPTPSRPR